jgi:hypothetical protein
MRADVFDVCTKFNLKGLEDHDYPLPGSIVQGDLTPLLLPGRGRLKLYMYIRFRFRFRFD